MDKKIKALSNKGKIIELNLEDFDQASSSIDRIKPGVECLADSPKGKWILFECENFDGKRIHGSVTKKNNKKLLFSSSLKNTFLRKKIQEVNLISEDLDQQIFKLEQKARKKISRLLGIRIFYEPKELKLALNKADVQVKKTVDEIEDDLKKEIDLLQKKHNPSVYDTNTNGIKLIHFSRSPDLTVLDPKYQGTAGAGEERSSPEYKNPPFINFYVFGSNSHIEPMFNGYYAYETVVKPSIIYDVRKGDIPTKDILKQGYKGKYFNFRVGEEQVRMFVPTKVKLIGKFSLGKEKRIIKSSDVYKYIEK